jgi:hypothetical protein
MMTRQEALSSGATRCYGRVCRKHPELRGPRNQHSHCIGCKREWSRRRQHLPEVREAQRKRQRGPEYWAQVYARRKRYRLDPQWVLAQRARRQRRAKIRRQTDLRYRLLKVIRTRIYIALKRAGQKKTLRTNKLIGCSPTFLREYISKQFLPGMSWDNYGEWHIDHIRQCTMFDLSKVSEQRTPW